KRSGAVRPVAGQRRHGPGAQLPALGAGHQLRHQRPDLPGAKRMSALIRASDLAAKLQDPNLVLLDVRWKLGATDNREQYQAGHIPAARFVDLETELSGPVGEHTGRHPLPTADA